MKVTVTYFPFGKELKWVYESLEEAFAAIATYHTLTSGNATYEIRVRA
jgi:hypothetical protein